MRTHPSENDYLPDWSECTNLVQAKDYLKYKVDKRNMKHRNDVLKYHDNECGKAIRERRKPLLSIQQAELLYKLADNVLYRNTLWMTTEELEDLLGVKSGHIKRKLESLEGIVRIRDTPKGEWRVDINPVYTWKYYGNSKRFYFTRGHAINSWLLETLENSRKTQNLTNSGS